MAFLRKNLAIDLGTTSVLVFTRAQGVILNEPSVVAVDTYTDKIVAVGEEAREMIGRTPGNIIAGKPMRDGVIADYEATERMLRYFLRKAVGRTMLGPDLIICVPSQATQVQKRAVVQAATAAGAHHTFLIEEPLAAAIGAGIDIADPDGHLIVDIGGGTTDVALISMGGIVISKSTRVAGDSFDSAIARYIRTRYSLIIGERTAEEIKFEICSVSATDPPEELEVKGRSLLDGLPVRVYVTAEEIMNAVQGSLDEIVDTIHEVLSDTPPELAADLYDRGLLLTGGGALVRGLQDMIRDRLKMSVHLAENPVTAVVRGTGKALGWIRRLKSGDEVLAENSRRLVMNREALRKR
ncbi:MAG: rod shape-determining protein [Peptoniphilaceae bacterium]|nr:rod shape-determining protein [Peptoniphilaceae bacterium]MDY5765984.1 rod shape-determining protein [Peptoniphilaceae bacterium]